MGTAQSLKRGILRVDIARKFGKEIPSRKLREKRSEGTRQGAGQKGHGKGRPKGHIKGHCKGTSIQNPIRSFPKDLAILKTRCIVNHYGNSLRETEVQRRRGTISAAPPAEWNLREIFRFSHRFWREILVKFSAAHRNPGKRSAENFTQISRQISRHFWQRKTEKFFTSALLQGSCSENDQSRPRKKPRASKRTSRRFSCGNS